MTGLLDSLNDFANSTLFEVRVTPAAGRGVFALQDIPRNTTLLATSAIASATIYSEYVKEVCAQCFAYDRGKTWKIRDHAIGVVFCSLKCEAEWREETVMDAGSARAKIQQLLRKSRKSGTLQAETAPGLNYKPSPAEVDSKWNATEVLADLIRACRASPAPTKAMRRALEVAQQPCFVDDGLVWYLLEGCILATRNTESWTVVEQLANDDEPYNGLDLARHIQAYTLLLATVPLGLLPTIQQAAIRSLQSHSTHNVFGLRSLDEGGEEGDAGSECFGYGLWPAASFWNHSCMPNLQKRRCGRTWRFWTLRDIRKGEELCITYLGGDERDLTTTERRQKLRESWGFQCACDLCARSQHGDA